MSVLTLFGMLDSMMISPEMVRRTEKTKSCEIEKFIRAPFVVVNPMVPQDGSLCQEILKSPSHGDCMLHTRRGLRPFFVGLGWFPMETSRSTLRTSQCRAYRINRSRPVSPVPALPPYRTVHGWGHGYQVSVTLAPPSARELLE